MCANSFGLLWRMPWMRYSFNLKSKTGSRKDLQAGILVDDISYDGLDKLDTENLLNKLGKWVSDDCSVESANWNLIYKTVHKKLTEDVKERNLRWSLSHIVKFFQNAAYLTDYLFRKSVPLGSLVEPITFARTFIAKNINEVNNNELTRIIFSCSKGDFIRHNLVTRAFLTLLDNEVVQRLNTFQSLHLLKILHSTIAISSYFHTQENGRHIGQHPFGIEFTRCLSTRLLQMISHIGSIDIANFVTIIAYYSLFNRTVSGIINKSFLKRLWNLKCVDPILTPAISLSMYGILDRKTAIVVLNSLESFGIPSYTSETDPRSVNSLLFSLKLLEMCIRHENVEVYESLPNRNRLYLKKIYNKIVKHVDHRDLLYGVKFNSGVIATSLNELMESEEKFGIFAFVPYIHGPYLMELCDPIHRIVIEFDEPWSLGTTPWLHTHSSHFHKMRTTHLENEGFKFLRIPKDLVTLGEQRKSILSNLLNAQIGMSSHSL